ncbi:hypothetical protein SKAU_G00170800 [Synaphobranchus kaupii]|uniref:Uncharacterized protein n=1 Tax=Synaphobranchus kaupii TaxID=118154 RepID=A0A9Q1J0P4_SYNKA|nr:hypothetical protein SKAU_G00170800 [Synaphobranchus kaupii]
MEEISSDSPCSIHSEGAVVVRFWEKERAASLTTGERDSPNDLPSGRKGGTGWEKSSLLRNKDSGDKGEHHGSLGGSSLIDSAAPAAFVPACRQGRERPQLSRGCQIPFKFQSEQVAGRLALLFCCHQ